MIKHLRTKLTVIFTILTSLVLIFMMVITFSISQNQNRLVTEQLLNAQIKTISDKILTDKSLSNMWLSDLEMNYQSIIHIEDNSHPLFFKGNIKTKTPRKKLISSLQSLGKEDHIFKNYYTSSSFITDEHRYFLSGDFGDNYEGVITQIFINENSYIIYFIKDISKQKTTLRNQIVQYCLISVVGTAIISFFIWHLTQIALRSTEKAIEDQRFFVASASHELRSPITVMKTSISAMETDPSSSTHFFSVIKNEIGRIARLVEDLTILQSSDSNSWDIKLRPLEMDIVCMEMYEAFLPVAFKNQKKLDFILPDIELPRIMGDKQRIEQIITILINNAIEYTPNGTNITMSVKMEKNRLAISISDNGLGLSDRDKKQIFNRFFRIDKSRHDKKHNGLGLSIASELVHMHKGTIAVKDTPGGGCTFVVLLPVNR